MYDQGGYKPPNQPQASPDRRPKRGVVFAVVAAVLVVIGVFIALTVRKAGIEHQEMIRTVEQYQDVYLPNTFVDDIPIGGMTAQEGLDAVLDAVNRRQNSWTLDLNFQGYRLTTLNHALLGIQTDVSQVYEQMKAAYSRGHVGTYEDRLRDIREAQQTPYSVYTAQSEMTDQALDALLAQLQDYLETAPTNASLVFFSPETDWDNPFGIQPETYGRHLDTAPLKEQILRMASAGESGTLEIQTASIAPAVTELDIRKKVSLRAEGVTPVASSSTTARTDNIRVAFSRYNGLTVNPGEKVSFNQLVGVRTMENGFQYAIEYANGLNSWGVGGGVCQASTTVYLAALQSGLEILERTSHSDAVSYTTFGQDATVYYTGSRKIDFVFRNSTDSPIYIAARVENVKKNTYQCVVRIYGEDMGNVKYTLRTETVEVIPVTLIEEYQKDVNHDYVTYTDEEPYLLRKARDGFINVTYLQRWENGTLIAEKEISRDECKARGTLYLVGTESR